MLHEKYKAIFQAYAMKNDDLFNQNAVFIQKINPGRKQINQNCAMTLSLG